MKKTILAMTIVSFLCLVGAGSASAEYSLQLQSGGPYTYGGVYVGPYTITVNGTAYALVCDDYLTDISVGYTWNAAAYSGSSLSGTKFDSQFGSAASENYAKIFYLAQQLELPANQAYIPAIDYALWQIADPAAPGVNVGGSGPTSSAYWTAMAAANWQSIDPSLFEIYTPDPTPASQEFILVNVPEPSTLLFLGLSLLMGAVALRLRARRAQM